MSKEQFNQEQELAQMETEAGKCFKELGPALLREGFEAELRGSLQMAIQKEREEKSSPNREEKGLSKGTFWQSWSRGGRLVACFLALVLCAGALIWSIGRLNPPVQTALAGEIEIKALDEDKLGVETASEFVLTSEKPLTEKTVQEYLKIEPAFAYTLDQKGGGKEYRIIPKTRLASNTVYRFAFDPEGKERAQFSWAFQTKGEFRVVRTLPGDMTTYVPVNTGIEFVLSHDNYSIDEMQKYFTISPKAEGTFEKHGRTLVFVPKAPLQAGTLYTITLKKGVPLLDSDSSLQTDYTFSFETEPASKEEASFSFDVNKDVEEFSSADAPVFSVYMFTQQKMAAATVSVYRYKDAQAFAGALRDKEKIPRWSSVLWNNYRQDFSGLSKVAEYQQDFQSLDAYSHFLFFPEALPAGYYAAEIKVQDCVRQVWFQVTDLAVYLAQGMEKNLFWVNNLKTKLPVQDAAVEFLGSKLTAKGNRDGVITLEQNLRTGEKEYALIKSKAGEIVVPLFNYKLEGQGQQYDTRDYWKYFYLERELFKPGDPIHFWGVLSPRKDAQKITEMEVTLEGSGRSYSWRQDSAPLLTQQVPVERNIFSGVIELPTLAPGYYYLEVRQGDTLFLSRGFTVELYQKPAYEISVEPEKKAIFRNEKLNFRAQASFFEGTPVAGVKLNYSIWNQSGQVMTDGQGVASIPYTARIEGNYGGPYSYVSAGVTAAMPEAGDIGTSSNIYVFTSKLLLEGMVEKAGEEFTLHTQVSGIDLSKINAGADLTRENYVSAPVAGQKINGVFYQRVWTKEEMGQRYNFISKQVEKIYSYNYSPKKLDEFTLVTDEAGKAVYKGTLDPKETYYIELTTQDAEGRLTQEQVYVHYGNAVMPDSYYAYYEVRLPEGQESFAGGEQVNLTLFENERQLPGKKQGYLFYRGQKEIETYQLLDEPQYSFNYAEADQPNTNVGAVYFDGISYHEALPRIIPFNRAKKALQVQIKTDQAEYRPGDKVQLQVKVTDEKNKPVKASVNLNLVDEAIYSMQEQWVDFLARLYQDFVWLNLNTKATHDHPQYDGGAEHGGEGGSERKDFRDTVLFTTVETDNRGEAQVEFVLPDNLTSWRVTYHALTQNLQAGSGTAQIPVRLPFFVGMVFNEQYLAGDAPIVVVRSYGEKVSGKDMVSYTMELRDQTGKTVQTKKQQGILTENIDWQLPTLKEGTYTLTIEGNAGNYRDKLSQQFTVVSSLLERTKTTHQLLAEDTVLTGSAKEPALIVFSDYEKSQYLRGLSRLAWQYGSRFEQKLAAREAKRLLNEYYLGSATGQGNVQSTGSNSQDAENLQAYQQADGGIAILPYAESDPAMTALVASLGSAGFDYGAMEGYFYDLLETGAEKGEDPTLALWGLGALGEPVLLDINAYLAHDDLAPAQQVHLALAMLDIGNGAAARQIYAELLGKYGEDLGNTYRVKIGQSQDEIVAATAQLAMLAAKLDASEKNKFYQYLLENPGQELLTNLEQLQVLQYQLRYLDSAPVSFTYERNGKTEQKTLKGRETFTLSVLPEELAQLKFTEISGKVGVMTSFSSPYQKDEIPARDDLAITRLYLVNGKALQTIPRGALVEIVIHYEVKDIAPGGRYEIVDVLPAGLKYVPRPYDRTDQISHWLAYPSEVKGQKISFQIGKGTGKIVYYARVISPGTFTAQGTLLSQVNNQDICILGPENRIEIK